MRGWTSPSTAPALYLSLSCPIARPLIAMSSDAAPVVDPVAEPTSPHQPASKASAKPASKAAKSGTKKPKTARATKSAAAAKPTGAHPSWKEMIKVGVVRSC